MSTVKDNITHKRIAMLAANGEQVFHVDDLAVLWRIKNDNTLHTTLKRYAGAGLIHRIQRGLYAIKEPAKLDKLLVGLKSVHGYAYISTETVLSRVGVINQLPREITIVSEVSERLKVLDQQYRVRQLADRYLYNDRGVIKSNGLMMATPERAAADLLYFNPRAHFDSPRLLNQKLLKQIQKYVFCFA